MRDSWLGYVKLKIDAIGEGHSMERKWLCHHDDSQKNNEVIIKRENGELFVIRVISKKEFKI